MNAALIIAADEWRYWLRSKLATAAALLMFVLICTSLFATFNQVTSERETREALQHEAEHMFRDQPARHPHRMVHYGHYVFRPPTPLAMLDPGVDPYTGTVMFLEGHRQNSATFSPTYDGAHAGPFARLTPALSYQLLVPLVLIIMGFGVVTREREAATDRQLVTSGISPGTLWFGKTLALLVAAGLILMPLLMGAAVSGSDSSVGVGFSVLYALYLVVWVTIIAAVSSWSPRASTSLLTLITIWVCLCVLAPRLLASAANVSISTASQIETDMDVIVALRAVGDGHNSNDLAFEQLRTNLLAEYEVERVEDLPINFRGVVAQAAEADLTDILNEYAEKRMSNQTEQTAFVRSLEFVSPFSVLQSASMLVAGTDVRTHHRFLREAEETRFQFVQDLNKVHAEQMAYADDIKRSSDPEAEQRTRMSSENWQVLRDFRFEPYSANNRLEQMTSSVLILIIWVFITAWLGWLGACRLPVVNNG